MLARGIPDDSPRSHKPFGAVNCGEAQQKESELEGCGPAGACSDSEWINSEGLCRAGARRGLGVIYNMTILMSGLSRVPQSRQA